MNNRSLALVILLLLSLNLIFENTSLITDIAFMNAPSKKYEETIFIYIKPYDGKVELKFRFANISGLPLDTSYFTKEPSFISIQIYGSYSEGSAPHNNTTGVIIELRPARLVNVSQGKFIADIMKEKIENFFNITLPFIYLDSSSMDRFYYFYEIEECPIIQKLRTFFLEDKPTQGFGEILTPQLIEHNVAIIFDLTRQNGNILEWSIEATVSYKEQFETSIWNEYTVSLKELTGHSETIRSSPESSISTLCISLWSLSQLGQFEMISVETTPKQMYKQPNSYSYSTTITGSSVDDLSLHFIFISTYILTAIITTVCIVVVAFALTITRTIIKRRKDLKSKLTYQLTNGPGWCPLLPDNSVKKLLKVVEMLERKC